MPPKAWGYKSALPDQAAKIEIRPLLCGFNTNKIHGMVLIKKRGSSEYDTVSNSPIGVLTRAGSTTYADWSELAEVAAGTHERETWSQLRRPPCFRRPLCVLAVRIYAFLAPNETYESFCVLQLVVLCRLLLAACMQWACRIAGGVCNGTNAIS